MMSRKQTTQNKWTKISQLSRVLCRIKLQDQFNGMYLIFINKKRKDCLRELRSIQIILLEIKTKKLYIRFMVEILNSYSNR